VGVGGRGVGVRKSRELAVSYFCSIHHSLSTAPKALHHPCASPPLFLYNTLISDIKKAVMIRFSEGLCQNRILGII
jgi:hypothetical protein